jgi:molybdopterin molybdotransferase
MISVQEAESLILQLVQPLNPQQDTEEVSLETAKGRILAKLVTSQLDFPHWDNSAMDGYAVCFADVQNCSAANPVILNIVEEIPAGCLPQVTLKAGQAARIFTGAMLPQGADTVVMQENTQRQNHQVRILEAPTKNSFVRQRGSFYQAGEQLLPSHIQIGAPEIAVLAAAQCQTVQVYRRPRVAILSTGDELVPIDLPLQPGQIVDSNQYALSAFVEQLGATPIPLGIVGDTPDALEAAITKAIVTADMVLSTGGVSVGDYDYVDEVLEKLGGDLQIRAVAVKPGKPLTVATFESHRCLYFGIPGNPVSALVSCWRFVQPALKKLSGLNSYLPQFVKAKTRYPLKAGGKRETYLWGQLQLVEGAYEFHLAGGSHSSGNLINLAQTNGLAVVPVGETQVAVGEEVWVMLVG